MDNYAKLKIYFENPNISILLLHSFGPIFDQIFPRSFILCLIYYSAPFSHIFLRFYCGTLFIDACNGICSFGSYSFILKNMTCLYLIDVYIHTKNIIVLFLTELTFPLRHKQPLQQIPIIIYETMSIL